MFARRRGGRDVAPPPAALLGAPLAPADDPRVDSLTGLWHFEHWRDRLDELSRDRAGGEKIGVVRLDLDDFTQLNAEFGDVGADEVIAAVGARLGRLQGWQFGRLQGADFVGLARHVRNEQHLEELCRALGGVLVEPISAGGVVVTSAGSVGRVLSLSRADDPGRLIGRAEEDLRERKALRVAPPRLTQQDMLQRLLKQGLDVAYQPVIGVQAGELVGWEALLRGKLPIHGALNPETVVDSAARTGALDLVMQQVAEQAVETVTTAARRLGRTMTLSLNLEPEQLRLDSPFLDWLVGRVAGAPVKVLLEITERGEGGCWSDDHDRVAEQLARHGIGLAIDDLGSGASRLPLLVRDHWDWVKLDRGFLLHGDRGLVVLRHTVLLLNELGLTVLLEGVETEEQLRLARELGVHLVQGHHLGRPAPAEQLLATLEAAPAPGLG